MTENAAQVMLSIGKDPDLSSGQGFSIQEIRYVIIRWLNGSE